MSVREELGQASWFVKDLAQSGVARRTVRARRGFRLPDLPRSRRRPGEIWAVSMVRDEEDVVGLTVDHLLAQGIDHVLVADNLSKDGTRQLLEERSRRDPRVHVALDLEPAYFQAEKMTRLARIAARSGADWVVPFDADELWFAESGTVGDHLRMLGQATGGLVGSVRALLHDTIPTGGDSPDLATTAYVMDSTPTPPGKVAIRAHRLMGVVVGNHGALRVGKIESGLRIAHLQYRSRAQVERKAIQGLEAVKLAKAPDYIGAHWSVMAELDSAAIDRTWAGMQRGEPQLQVHHFAHGPMVTVRPLPWSVWDPADEVLSPAERDA